MLGYPEYVGMPLFSSIASRMTNMKEVNKALKNPKNDIGVEKALEILIAADIPCSPCIKRDEIELDEQIKAIGALETYVTEEMGKLTVTSPPVLFEGELASHAKPSPLLGQHGHEILTELGWSEAKVQELIESGTLLVTSP